MTSIVEELVGAGQSLYDAIGSWSKPENGFLTPDLIKAGEAWIATLTKYREASTGQGGEGEDGSAIPTVERVKFDLGDAIRESENPGSDEYAAAFNRGMRQARDIAFKVIEGKWTSLASPKPSDLSPVIAEARTFAANLRAPPDAMGSNRLGEIIDKLCDHITALKGDAVVLDQGGQAHG